jgi:acetyl esterase/lipase
MIELARRATARHDRPMATNEASPIPGISRVADLRLRGPAGTIPVRVRWARSAADDPAPALVLLLPDAVPGDGVERADDRLALELCSQAGAVVLCVPWAPGRPGALDRADAALTWVAEHGTELGGDPARLVIAGCGAGAAAVAALALRARDRGWPPIRRQVLVLGDATRRRPARHNGGAARATVKPAPAVVVTAGGRSDDACAEWLRATGSDVQVLDGVDALPAVLREAVHERKGDR